MLRLSLLEYVDIADFAISKDLNRNDLEKINNQCKDNNLIFCDIPFIDKITQFLIMLCKTKKIKINLILTMYDKQPSETILRQLEDICYKIFVTNLSSRSPRFFHLPIAFRMNQHNPHYHIENEKKIERSKEHMVFMCFTISTNRKAREECWNEMIEKPFVYYEPQKMYDLRNIEGQYHCGIVPIPHFYEHLHKSFFCVCPEGDGVDTHRFYESIYLDCIPIVKHSILDKLYSIYPCLIINEWSDITYEFLNENKERLLNNLYKFKLANPEWYNNPEYFIEHPIASI